MLYRIIYVGCYLDDISNYLWTICLLNIQIIMEYIHFKMFYKIILII
jgi:hypothetical protein